MPLYDYQCPRCEQVKEVMHTIAELDNPSKETIEEISCRCIGLQHHPIRMVRTWVEGNSVPGIATMTASRGPLSGEAKKKIAADRKKRSDKHFKKEIYQTVPKEERHNFTKKHGLKS